MFKHLHIILLLLLLPLYTTAQNDWQWGKRGGSSSTTNNGMEGNLDMLTDSDGNVYALAPIDKGGAADVDGYLSNDPNNTLSLSKWDCEGYHQWTKYFGGTSSLHVIPHSVLGMDSLGGLYFMGGLNASNNFIAYFDTDTLIQNTNKQWFIVKYDTSGAFQWLQMPQADTVSLGIYGTANKNVPRALDVAPDGTLYIYAGLVNGLYSNILEVNGYPNFYLLKYNKDGAYLDAVSLDIEIEINEIHNSLKHGAVIDPRTNFKRDHQLGNFYIYGGRNPYMDTISYGGIPINPGVIYITAFDSLGNHLWLEQSTTVSSNTSFCRPQIDEYGNVYILGQVFQNIEFLETSIEPGNMLLSITKDGNLRWYQKGSKGSSGLSGIHYSNGIVGVSDVWTTQLTWDDVTLTMQPANGVGKNHLALFNAHSGKLVSPITTYDTYGSNSNTKGMTGDHKGNFYIGGNLSQKAYIGNDTLSKFGGYFDFYVAKHGSGDCNCSLASSEFSFSSEEGSTTVDFTYTGENDVDSVRWEFGDGTIATGLTTTHTYSTLGTYEVSIIVYNDCGIAGDYQEVTTGQSTSINDADLMASLKVYPNPAQERIHIEGAGIGTQFSVYNIIGQNVINGTIQQSKEVVDVASLNAGMYILRFKTIDGRIGHIKVRME